MADQRRDESPNGRLEEENRIRGVAEEGEDEFEDSGDSDDEGDDDAEDEESTTF